MSKQVLLENIYKAYYAARKNKRNTKDQLLFEVDYETQLHQLFESICNRTYTVSVSKAFVVEKPCLWFLCALPQRLNNFKN